MVQVQSVQTGSYSYTSDRKVFAEPQVPLYGGALQLYRMRSADRLMEVKASEL